ncbi:MAG TPA: hypothetical protein VHV55_03370 [Pirellulales bacterium]|nr:hypothetical protein [Pirellulales bacterium]
MRARIMACGLAALVAFPVFLAAQPPGDLRVARLIKQLGSQSFADRTVATNELERLGPTARQQLTAAAQDPDPEVRLHAKDLLARLDVRDLWAASEASCTAAPISASKLLAVIGEQTGNHLLLGDQYGTFHEHEMTLEPGKQPFWPLVDRICQASGNRVRPHFDPRQPGLVIVSGDPGKYPVAYAGPIRGQLTTARRSFNEELSYETSESDVSHLFQIGLQLAWEDRFHLVAYRSQPDIVSATTAQGVKLPLAATAAGTWNVASPGTRQVSTTLRLQPPPIAARELDALVLRWALIAVGDMATIEIKDFASHEPHFQDDVELSVESVQANGAGQYAVTLRITRDLTIPEPAEVIFQENEIELFDAQQKPFRNQGQTNTLSEDGAKMVVNFVGDSAESVPQRMTFTYPRLRSQKEVELVFRHVPLPVTRPE